MATAYQDDANAQRELNAKLKAQPWYQAWASQNGIDLTRLDGHTVRLTDPQKKSLEQLFAANGVQLPSGTKVDTAGQITPKHGFAGQPGWVKAIEIGGALAAGGYLAAPLFAGAAPALGAGEASTTLAATGGLVPGLSTAATVAGAAAPVAGTIAKIGQAAKTGLSTYDKISGILGDTGKAIGDATTAAGNNRLEANTAAERAAHQNLTDSIALKRSDADQATQDRQALYRSTVAQNPMTSPFNTKGPQVISPEMMAGLSDMEKQALLRIGKGPTPFTPYVPKPASTLEQVGNWASPIASTIGAIGKYL